MRPRILLVNGPPRCGKDTFGKFLKANFEGVFTHAFAWALKVRTHGAYGCPEAPAMAFEDVKDAPHRVFRGLTPRQAYINFSERFFKPIHGDDVWGRIMLEAMQWADVENGKKGMNDPLYVITDSGFAAEARVLIEQYGKDAVQLVRLHRAGCNFKNDSRSHIDLPEIVSRDIHADNLDQLEGAALELATEFSLTPRKESPLGKLIQFPVQQVRAASSAQAEQAGQDG